MIEFYARVGDRILPSSDAATHFPAGERHTVDNPYDDETPLYVVIRGTDANEYISAAMWVDLQHQRGHRVAAIIPYLPGARQDRGRPFGAQVYANLINAIKADQVITFDPHSPVMPRLIDNLTVVYATELVRDALGLHYIRPSGVIAPDAGARDRSLMVAQALNIPLYFATKTRNPRNGELSGFSCEPLPDKGLMVVPDDICDGGRTFTGLAKATGLPRERLALYVSHGVFSGDYGHLLQLAYGHILTTDSHPGHSNPAVQADITQVLPYLVKEISL